MDPFHCTSASEVHIGFIHQNHAFTGRHYFLQLFRFQAKTGRRIGIGYHHQLFSSHKSFGIHCKIFFQRHNVSRNAIKIGKHAIKAVSQIRESRPGLCISHKSKIQDFIGSVCHKNVFRSDPVSLGQFCF